ncbi:O-antigen translocase [Winogradskyella alexanderae]|uniref:O-antigen translocase n=1 Tax=Winogradskyella alexanderae TaxID=2877123 RepID=A0ABS7XS64_9FLAO|nr:O-antigen translocase [Winogradskyella alexanderae]MCA0132858.1 O-antigen translocase [Winogradskyella alexanderae]
MKDSKKANTVILKFPDFIRNNIVLKITSLNAVVISIRLIVSVIIQRLLAVTVGEAGIASIGQIRNILAMLSSTSTLGTFSGLVKYVSEFKNNRPELTKVFSTATVFLLLGAIISALVLFVGADYFTNYVFKSNEFTYVFKVLAIIVPFIALSRVISGVVNGLSDYKKYAKIELISYLIASVILVVGLYSYNLQGVIIAIVIAPIIQLITLVAIFGKTLTQYVKLKNFKLQLDYRKNLMAFTLMSFISAFLINYIELEIRTLVTDEININEAGYWTAITFISKNYMVFATGLFTLYVLPRFASIHGRLEFTREVLTIYKTILPIFFIGMLLVYLSRNYIIQLIYPNFTGMEPLFKWQLLGDFIRLCALVLAYQFLAKKLVSSFVITELISLVLFYVLTKLFLNNYGTEGVVIAHFVRYAVYLIVVIIFVHLYYRKQSKINA